MRILGIDPGLGGALALIDTGLDFLLVRDMPVMPIAKGKHGVSPVQVADLLDAWEPDLAYVERVHAMKGQGVTSCFNFGMGYGILLGALGSKRVPYHLITPQEWKKHFRMPKDKDAARAMAVQMFPTRSELFSRVKDDGRAEAALIAAFGLSCSVPTHTQQRQAA